MFLMTYPEAFVRITPLGAVAGVRLPDRSRETARAGGRVAFWRAARALGFHPGGSGDFPSGPRGEPILPAGLAGSISHKETLAVALVARAEAGSLGVDLEALAPERPAIEDIALRKEEREALAARPEAEQWRALVTAFALKEALYKALHPHLQRYVRYDEAAVVFTPAPRIELHLDGGAAFVVESDVDENVEGHVLALVRVGR